jgi:hypothetical protein
MNAALQRRAREEGVTIHAAISAALTIAGRVIGESWRNNPLQSRNRPLKQWKQF